jgi:hypothetical protein
MEKVGEGIYRGVITPFQKQLSYPISGKVFMVRVSTDHDMSKNPKQEPVFRDKPLPEYIDPDQFTKTLIDIVDYKQVEKDDVLKFSGDFESEYQITVFYSEN